MTENTYSHIEPLQPVSDLELSEFLQVEENGSFQSRVYTQMEAARPVFSNSLLPPMLNEWTWNPPATTFVLQEEIEITTTRNLPATRGRKRIAEDWHFSYLENMIFKRNYGAQVILISSMGTGPKARANRNILFLRTDCLLFTEKRTGNRTVV